MIITISGTPGSGKSTIAKVLVNELKLDRIYVGGIRRNLAREKNMTLEELNEYALTHPETDVDVDKEAARQARLKKNVVVEGRTQFYFLPESIKIYIKVDLIEGAKRIWNQIQDQNEKNKRNENQSDNFDQMLISLKKRMENDQKRYLKYYNIDCYDENNYDLVVDTTKISSNEASEKIINFIKNFN